MGMIVSQEVNFCIINYKEMFLAFFGKNSKKYLTEKRIVYITDIETQGHCHNIAVCSCESSEELQKNG